MTEDNKRYQTIADQIKEGNTDDAIIGLKEILLSNPDDLIALSMSGSAYMRAGDETKAFNFFEAAIKADPDSFSAHGDLAFAAMKCGQADRAIIHFEKALEIKPDYYPAWNFIEALYFQKRDYAAAVNAVEKSESLDPMDEDYKEMQNALKNDYLENAEKMARSMIARHPGHPRGSFMLAHLASRAGAHEECTKILRYALQHHPETFLLLINHLLLFLIKTTFLLLQKFVVFVLIYLLIYIGLKFYLLHDAYQELNELKYHLNQK